MDTYPSWMGCDTAERTQHSITYSLSSGVTSWTCFPRHSDHDEHPIPVHPADPGGQTPFPSRSNSNRTGPPSCRAWPRLSTINKPFTGEWTLQLINELQLSIPKRKTKTRTIVPSIQNTPRWGWEENSNWVQNPTAILAFSQSVSLNPFLTFS